MSYSIKHHFVPYGLFTNPTKRAIFVHLSVHFHLLTLSVAPSPLVLSEDANLSKWVTNIQFNRSFKQTVIYRNSWAP